MTKIKSDGYQITVDGTPVARISSGGGMTYLNDLNHEFIARFKYGSHASDALRWFRAAYTRAGSIDALMVGLEAAESPIDFQPMPLGKFTAKRRRDAERVCNYATQFVGARVWASFGENFINENSGFYTLISAGSIHGLVLRDEVGSTFTGGLRAVGGLSGQCGRPLRD